MPTESTTRSSLEELQEDLRVSRKEVENLKEVINIQKDILVSDRKELHSNLATRTNANEVPPENKGRTGQTSQRTNPTTPDDEWQTVTSRKHKSKVNSSRETK